MYRRSLPAEEPVEETDEEWNDDQKEQRRQVAEDEHEHEPPFDLSGRGDGTIPLGGATLVPCLADQRERAAPEIPGPLEHGGERRDAGETLHLRGRTKRAEQRCAEEVALADRVEHPVKQSRTRRTERDRRKRGLGRPAGGDERLESLDDDRTRPIGGAPAGRGAPLDEHGRRDRSGVGGEEREQR